MTAELDTLRSIDSGVRAILMLMVETAKENRPKDLPSVEGILYRAGFTTQTDIVAMTGTPKSTVSLRLKDEGLT
jgi:uncharacterized membrane protein